MVQGRGAFWLPAILGVVGVWVLARMDLARPIPALYNLLSKSGAPGFLAAAVTAVAIWILVALLVRGAATSGQIALIRRAREALQNAQAREWHGSTDDYLMKSLGPAYGRSILRRRFLVVSNGMGSDIPPERAVILMAGQSSVDAATTQSAYGPLRALTWALPTFGFMGTAFEMADAVGGLGVALSQTQGYDDLRNLLVGAVVPHLAGAFNVTLLALGGSVVCFVLLSLANAREEAFLNEADTVSLLSFSRVQDTRGVAEDGRIGQELLVLIDHLTQLNNSVAQLQQSIAAGLVPMVSSAGALLEHTVAKLEQIRLDLEAEMVVVRRPRQTGQ